MGRSDRAELLSVGVADHGPGDEQMSPAMVGEQPSIA